MRKIILSAALVFTLGLPLASHGQQAGGGAGTGAAGSPVGGTGGAGTGNALGGSGTSGPGTVGTGSSSNGADSTVGGTQTPSTGSFGLPSTQPLNSSGLGTGTGNVNGLGQTSGTGGAGQVGSGTGTSSFGPGAAGTGTVGTGTTGTTITQPGTVPGTSASIPPLGGTSVTPGTVGTGTSPVPGTGQVGSTPVGGTPAPNTTGTNTGVGAPGGASTQGVPGGSAALTPQQAQEEIARLQSEVRRLQAEADRNRDEGTGGSGTVGEDAAVASAVFEGRVKDVSQKAIEVIDFETGEPYLLRVNEGTRATRGAQRIPLARIQEGSRVRASFDWVSGESVATNIQVLKRR
ncbi:hypothetical protein [Stigmatella erecta]|uniref:DUF5666 domain-containing protein n=1 Tax=Stigmatella erecta TaxID=83460 RepID=A0A1I0L7D9_9BACT|nr:hypothetical protein [Stigmatella erecta]SEU35892.1 hypothetical protein SAMN05443639_12159 [Stigmatella erecta]